MDIKKKVTSQGDDTGTHAVQENPETAKGRVRAYEVPKGEEGSVHAEIEQVQFDAATGRKKSVPTVQKFDPRAWDNFRRNAVKLGYTHIRVLHAPEGVDTEVLK